MVLDGLTVGYARHAVLTDINATLRGGELTCLVGPNGSGKSTLLRTLTAFVRPIAGHINICIPGEATRELTSLSPATLSRLVSVVLTERTDLRNMTVRETVALGRSPYTGFWGGLSAADRQLVDEAVAAVGLSALSARKVGTLSDGERQKTMIAKAVAQQTPVVMLDEPTAFLDYPSRVDTMQLLRRMAHDRGKAVLLSTHDMELATQYADIFWVACHGTLTVGAVDSFDHRFYDHWVEAHL